MYQEALSAALPEVIIAVMACFILIISLFLSKRYNWVSYLLSQLTAVGAAFSVHYVAKEHGYNTVLDGAFTFDKFGAILKIIIALTFSVIFLYSKKYINDIILCKGEYFALCLFSMLGMMILVSSGNLLVLYLGIELMALPIYALIAMIGINGNSKEAAMKYFIMGTVASGLLLFGISLAYGVVGSIDFIEMNSKLYTFGLFNNLALQFGLIFITAGIAFKFGAAPFHMWVPDVYHGSPVPIVLIIGTVSKVAAFGMAFRLLSVAFYNMASEWCFLIIITACTSLLLGNIVAIVQVNLKRMLAYSTISHVGFILLGFLYGIEDGYVSSIFYLIVYLVMSLGTFGMILILTQNGIESENISDFKGLAYRSPWLATIMMILLLGLAGIPPTVGFYAKFLVLQGFVIYEYFGVAILAVLTSVIGAFYYLRVIKVMFFDKPDNNIKLSKNLNTYGIHKFGLFLVSFNGIVVLLLGVYPAPILNLCISIF